jgi:hypothetical protein
MFLMSPNSEIIDLNTNLINIYLIAFKLKSNLKFNCIFLALCHTWFSKEQNQTNHMCAQEVHTYVRMKKYQKQC